MVKAINQRIEGTNVYVFSHDDEGNYTFFRPFELDEARQIADATNKAIAYYDVKVNNGEGLEVDEYGVEIFNLGPLRGILANMVLMDQTSGQSWLPTIREGTHLQRARLYRTEISIDHGLALYSEENPCSKVAQSLAKDAERLGIGALPVFASFRALDLKNGGEGYGVIPQLVSTEGLYSGEELKELARENRFVLENSGVRWLGRYSDYFLNGWLVNGAGKVNLNTNNGHRVVGLSSIGDKKILNNLVQKKIRQNYDYQRKVFKTQLSELPAREKATIKSAEAVLNA